MLADRGVGDEIVERVKITDISRQWKLWIGEDGVMQLKGMKEDAEDANVVTDEGRGRRDGDRDVVLRDYIWFLVRWHQEQEQQQYESKGRYMRAARGEKEVGNECRARRSREGKTNEFYGNKRKNVVVRTGERKRGETRCGCPARMSVCRIKEIWVVKYFIEQHNHPLVTPRKVHLLRSHRDASATKRALMQEYTEANISTCQQVRLFEIDAGETNQRRRHLIYHVAEDLLTCSCKHFEFEGYLCRHMLCWMRVEQVMLVSKMYIKERWTKNANNNLVYATSHNLVAGQSILGRRGTLMQLTRELIDEASLTEGRSKFLMEEIKVLKIEIGGIDAEECTTSTLSRIKSQHEIVRVSDPEPVRTKGCDKRLKSGKEKSMLQSSRTCSFCHRTGHDKRKCPDFAKFMKM
ncbi:FAR1-related protein [Striga asiatica]|uniref:FAR1-related protein n=1 Tax=Striga asiatica TaxID=4170 RepID=A0A5A7Q7N7_STRAF|nr:FAR1-related protein [Striga asiatica]